MNTLLLPVLDICIINSLESLDDLVPRQPRRLAPVCITVSLDAIFLLASH